MALPASRSAFFRNAGMKCWLTSHFSHDKIARFSPVTVVQVATMRATYGEKYPYSKPWPYKEKKLNPFNELFDSSKERMNENSKVIVVEGNIGSGKHDFAERIAKGFDFQLFETTHDDDIFKCEGNGYDVRHVDEVLPESAQAYDLKKFLNDAAPQHGKAGRLQLLYFLNRTLKYCNALLHLLSTGQGVVIVRSPFSDSIFVDALRKMGWVTPKYVPWYNEVRADVLCMLLKPHLTIFLDAPVGTCLDNIKKRKDPREGKNLNENYLQFIDKSYKSGWLNQQRETHEVMEIDWTGTASDMDMDVIIEEMQRFRLEREDSEDSRFTEWEYMSEDEMCHFRKIYADEIQQCSWFERAAPWHLPEIVGTQADMEARQRYVAQHPALKYMPGWAPEFGNAPLFKL